MTNKRTINVLILLSILFSSLIVYLTYFEFALSDKVAQNPFNQRQAMYENDIERGQIFDRDGVVLAETKNKKHVYPYNNLYSHVIGYNSPVYGKSMLELKYNKQLLGLDGITKTFNLNNEKVGYDLYLTIDHSIQKLASDSLGNRNGAVVAINPKNGEIIAMVSKPDFNPNSDALADNWNDLNENEKSPLLPRATSGLYAPGSTFKMITISAALEQGLDNMKFNDTGKVTIGSKTFENQKTKAYGNIDIYRGFEVSSNVVFCTLGAQMGSDVLKDAAERFEFNKPIDFDLPVSKSIFPSGQNADELAAALGIGQGKILATPLEMALVTAAIANDGVMMKPNLVKSIKNKSGFAITTAKPQIMSSPISFDIAYEVKQAMINTVKKGTASGVAIRGIEIGAKTGTAENELSIKQKNKEHTWFAAFAPADDPQIAVAVMMEYSGGTGGGNCAPIAREIIRRYLQNNK